MRAMMDVPIVDLDMRRKVPSIDGGLAEKEKGLGRFRVGRLRLQAARGYGACRQEG
jgi:hypothetical protein